MTSLTTVPDKGRVKAVSVSQQNRLFEDFDRPTIEYVLHHAFNSLTFFGTPTVDDFHRRGRRLLQDWPDRDFYLNHRKRLGIKVSNEVAAKVIARPAHVVISDGKVGYASQSWVKLSQGVMALPTPISVESENPKPTIKAALESLDTLLKTDGRVDRVELFMIAQAWVEFKQTDKSVLQLTIFRNITTG